MSEQESTTLQRLFAFDQHPLQTHVDAQGELWWVATEVASLLGIQNERKRLSEFPANEKGVALSYTNAGKRTVTTINTFGLYRFIFQSRKPEAEPFKLWAFNVIKTVMRTGTYTIPGHAAATPSHHLPPPQQPIRERAEVSEHMLAVWGFLRRASDPVSNQEIADQSRMKVGTVRKHTRYFLHLGLVDLYETFPRHLFAIPAQADKRHPAFWQRLERLAAIVEQRQQQLWS